MLIRFFFILALTLFLSACATGGIEPIGDIKLNPLPDDSPVYVYLSEKEVEAPFKVIGLLSYTDPGKYQFLSLNSIMPQVKAEARRAGANGIIIDEYHVVKSGIVSTGIGVTGRAIFIER